LERGVFQRRADGAIVADLEKIGLKGEKVLLRSDGTSVYMTQDLGTALRRFDELAPQRMIYVVADEQNFHFQVLFGLLGLLKEGAHEQCYHLSYGMVDLPHGRMKSREGTVVDADNLMDELHAMALAGVKERYADLSEAEMQERAEKIAQAGLKFFILRFSPQGRIRFDPEESIAFHGETGPYALYSYARINAIYEKAGALTELPDATVLSQLSSPLEIAILKQLIQFPQIIREAAEGMNPSRLTSYLFQLAQAFSSFYQDPDHRIADAPSPRKEARLALCKGVQAIVKAGLKLLAIDTIERM
jgi:arginyl-tRNA synthetase